MWYLTNGKQLAETDILPDQQVCRNYTAKLFNPTEPQEEKVAIAIDLNSLFGFSYFPLLNSFTPKPKFYSNCFNFVHFLYKIQGIQGHIQAQFDSGWLLWAPKKICPKMFFVAKINTLFSCYKPGNTRQTNNVSPL